MEIIDEIVTGNLNFVINDLVLRISELQRYNYIKIGQTTNLKRRVQRHSNSKKHNWQKMVALYSSSSHKNISYVEKYLISHLKEFHFKSAINIAPGGEGVNKPNSHSRFYIYVLVKSKKSCR